MRAILDALMEQKDEEYAAFQRRLIPTIPPESVIGVRTPILRAMAKELFRDAERRDAFFEELPHTYYEENQLHFFTLSLEKDFEESLRRTEAFLPYVDNWSTCDQPFPRAFARCPERLLPVLPRWLDSDQPYTVRFAIGCLMRLYLEEWFDDRYPQMVARVQSEHYYVRMMQAWYFATALAKQWEAILPFLVEKRLDPWTHNKIIQKARESDRIDGKQKEYLKSLKIEKKTFLIRNDVI